MKKNIFTAAIFFIFVHAILGQVTQEWAKSFTNGNYFDTGYKVRVDAQGNVYVIGDSYSGSNTESYNGILLKYNNAGILQWSKVYNGPANNEDFFRDIDIDKDGNIYIAGAVTLSGTTKDALLLKYNSSGTLLWSQTYNGAATLDDYAMDMEIDTLGNIYIAGGSSRGVNNNDALIIKYNSSGGFLWANKYNGSGNASDFADEIKLDKNGNAVIMGTTTSTSSTKEDYLIIKYGPDGTEQWVQKYNGSGNNFDTPSGIVIDNSQNIFVTGSTTGAGTLTDVTTLKYSPSGVLQWAKTYDGPAVNYDNGYAIALDSTGNVICAGASSGIGSNRDCLVLKYNTSGTLMWEARYNGPNNSSDALFTLSVDKFGNIYTAGYCGVNNVVWDDYVTIKYNSTGVQQWNVRYNGNGNSSDQALGICLDASNNLYVTGQTWGTSSTNWDITTIKYSQLVSVYQQSNFIPDNFSLSQNYPNPFNPTTKIDFDLPFESKVTISIYDMTGREVMTLLNGDLKTSGYYTMNINASALSSGTYFYTMKAEGGNNNFVQTKKMMLVK
ncbi:MAG: SBBP repeat-containing protein [Bacteroidetes bacterium]|nr:SBBP repeat-containing protein [Bacteroidota bacterium]